MQSVFLSENGLTLASSNDAVGIVFSGLPGCVVRESDLPSSFFDLESGVAGDILQKFVNYRFRAGFIVASEHVYGDRVTELIRDYAGHPYVRFFESESAAITWLEEL